MQRYKPKRFGIIESDVCIDFKKKQVTFPNPTSIFDAKYIVSAFIIALFLDLVLLVFYTDLVINPMIYETIEGRPIVTFNGLTTTNLCISFFLTIPLSYGIVLFAQVPNMPFYHRANEKVRNKMHMSRKPNRKIAITNPKHVKLTMLGSFKIRFQGTCIKHRDKLYYNNIERTLEISFSKQSRGMLIIEEMY